MRPPASQVLFGMFMRLSGMAEQANDDFARGELRIIGILSALLSVEAERGVAVRVAEIEGARTLVARGADVVPAPLSGELQQALAASEGAGLPDDLTVSALDGRMATLQEGFIRLQRWLEEHPEHPGARELLAECWQELHASVGRRALPLP